MKQEATVLIQGLRQISADVAALADQLEGCTTLGDTQDLPAKDPEEAPAKRQCTLEDVRGILAEKSRTGFRAEVKAILTAHGVKQLSDITDPEELAAVAAEAEVIGSG